MKNQTLKGGYVELISNGYYTHALTLKPNSKTFHFSDATLFRKIGEFHNLLDKKLVGCRFHKEKYRHLRTEIIAVCEGTKYTGHIHCAIRVHDSKLPKFRAMFPSDLTKSAEGQELWERVAVGGTIVVKDIYDAEGWAKYMTKSLSGDQCSDRVKVLPE
tara:strand:+ start:3162 stop:3638 length:477 start_codon:yes stop_codon:yes gene_type:complete